MIRHVNQRKVSKIFSTENDNIYKIPKYQREYTWSKSHWNALFEDIIANEPGYFLGSYICVSDSGMNNTLELIDGQQRFTTLMILFSSIYKRLQNLSSEMDEDDIDEYKSLRKQLANKSVDRNPDGEKIIDWTSRIILQHQNCNDQDFDYLMYDTGITNAYRDKPLNFGNRRIGKAFSFFSSSITEFLEDKMPEPNPKFEIDNLFALTDKINSAILVGIEVDTHKDAYMLFESLNHRGVPLTAIDLIKNSLIMHSEKDNATEKCYDLWTKSLQHIGDNYSVQERFFRHFYNGFRNRLNTPFREDSDKRFPLGPIATRTTMMDIFDKLIKNDYWKFINDLYSKSTYYEIILNKAEETFPFSDELEHLERIGGAPSYMLLMHLLANQEKYKLTDEDIETVAQLLVKFFVRRNVTDVPSTRKLDRLFMGIIDGLVNDSPQDICQYIKDELMKVSATDEAFANKLRGSLYLDNPDSTRFILCRIEESSQTRENKVDLWARNRSKNYVFTIEHIFPEGENIPQYWVEMIADGDREKAKELQDAYVHTLGNLTLTGYNSSLSNLSFHDKKIRTTKDKTKKIGYLNGLKLNEDVASEDEWTINKIQKRTDKLVNVTMHLFAW